MTKNQKNEEEIVENYTQDDGSMMGTLVSLIWLIISISAIYYSFEINKGFHFGSFLLALFFAPFYLLWGIWKVGIPPKVKINMGKKGKKGKKK